MRILESLAEQEKGIWLYGHEICLECGEKGLAAMEEVYGDSRSTGVSDSVGSSGVRD